MKTRLSRTSLLLLFLFVFVHGGLASALQEVIYKDERPLKNLFETQKEGGKKETSTEEEEEVGYIYDPTGKTDPFKSFIAARQEVVQEKKKSKPKTYLETLDLSQLELIAIMVGPKGSWAMVRESKGTGHVIQKGTPIGLRGGVVHEITDKEVIIREEYKDFKDRTKYRDVVKKVPSLH